MKNWNEVSVFARDTDIPVIAEVDVLVVGGGPAGVAAATTVAESGLSVAIVEKYGFFGGAAVAGMSGTICGMYLATETNTEPEQVVFGFTERFRSLLEEKNGVTGPQIYGKTWTVTHDPLKWREVADELIENAGVRIFLHTTVTGVVMEGQEYFGAVVTSSAGTAQIRAKRTIDASGDAAMIAKSGNAYFYGDQGRIQNPTMFFRVGNVEMDTYLEYYGEDTIAPEKVSDALVKAREEGKDLPRNHIWIFPTTRPKEVMVNATRLTAADGRMLNVIDPEDFTIAEIRGRKQVRAYAEFLADHVPGMQDSYVVDTGVEAGIRQTRSIVGEKILTNQHVVDCTKTPDGIVRSPWPIELHDGERPKLHWLLDDYYEVPYLTLVPKTGENIIVAGRCLSAEHEALASARVTAQCFEYGHAAAQATIISLEENIPYRNIPGQTVRSRMVANNSQL